MASKLFFFLLMISSAAGHNITKILSQFPNFSSLNSLLIQTQLTSEINSRQTITVLAVDNSALSSVSGQPADVLQKILSLHVVLDYYDANKLAHLSNKSIILTTLFQTTGHATGQSGFLNVTDIGGSQIAIGSAVPGSGLNSHLVKLVASQPYNISVLEISSVIIPPGIAGGDGSNHSTAPTPAPKAAPVPIGSVSPSPSDSGSLPPSHPIFPAPAATPSQAPARSSPGPAIDGPVSSPPSPPAADAPAPGVPSSVADAPGPVTESESKPSAACRVVAELGLSVGMGAAFFGAL